MKYLDCMPEEVRSALSKLSDVREIRIRNYGRLRVNVAGKWYYLGQAGMTQQQSSALTVGEVCDGIVKTACNGSVYAYEKMLAQGFFTLEDGARFGVCGKVKGNGVFQNYSSLCVRIPHVVNCVGKDVFDRCKDKNVVVIGVPGSGKTTFLRDFAMRLSATNNVLVSDERGELFFGKATNDANECDVLKWCDKTYAFETAIRAMSPDYIVCDELSAEDVVCVGRCVDSGVKLVCSAHGRNVNDFERRFGLLKYFDMAVLLDKKSFRCSLVELVVSR